MSKIYSVSLTEFKVLLELAQENHTINNEPIPEINPSRIGQLESCLNTPFQKFMGFHFYRGFIKKAAILFYLIIKNHPLDNGNKRMACLCLSYFCAKNNHDLIIPGEVFYELSKFTADSNNKEMCVKQIEIEIKKYAKNV